MWVVQKAPPWASFAHGAQVKYQGLLILCDSLDPPAEVLRKRYVLPSRFIVESPWELLKGFKQENIIIDLGLERVFSSLWGEWFVLNCR